MLKGKVAVVTGGTRGIGFAIVKKYLENGAIVVYPNLSDAKKVEEAIEAVKEQYGRIDILVNNAGISDSTKVDDYEKGQYEKVINLNVNSIFYAVLPTVKIMKEQGGGCIINTSSMVSISGQPGGVAYPTSKFAVNGLTLSLARELGPSNILANAFVFLASDMASYVTGEVLSVDGAMRA